MCKLCLNVGNVELLYKNDVNLKRESVEILQEWMKKEYHLPKITDYQMAMFLNSCYYRIEPTKTCIENYYTLRSHWPEFFSNRSIEVESLKIHMKSVVATPLPQMGSCEFQACYGKLHNCKTETFNFNDVIKIIDMSITLHNPQLGPKKGHVLIIDGKDLLLGHVFKMNLMTLKKYFFFVQEAMPVRLKHIHIINVNSIVEKFINLMKSCLTKELQEQMYCHKKIESLWEFVPKETLPSEYGGLAGTIQNLLDKQVENFKEHIDLLIEDESFKSDESKRVGEPKNLKEIFGSQGTFKKLDID